MGPVPVHVYMYDKVFSEPTIELLAKQLNASPCRVLGELPATRGVAEVRAAALHGGRRAHNAHDWGAELQAYASSSTRTRCET